MTPEEAREMVKEAGGMPEPEEVFIDLHLPLEMAKTLYGLMGAVAGDTNCSYRAHTQAVRNVLADALKEAGEDGPSLAPLGHRFGPSETPKGGFTFGGLLAALLPGESVADYPPIKLGDSGEEVRAILDKMAQDMKRDMDAKVLATPPGNATIYTLPNTFPTTFNT